MSSRSLVDRPDDYSGGQVHVIYALPKGVADQQMDVTNRIPFSLASVNRWLETKIGRKVKFDTYKGDVDIEFVQLPKTDAEYGTDDVTKFYAIYGDTTSSRTGAKDYLVFYDGRAAASAPGVCGRAFAPGSFALVYMHGGCWQDGESGPVLTADAQPTRPDFIPMHELFHTFGAQHTPPLASDAASVLSQTEYFNLECDLMYVKNNTCTFLGWFLDPYQMFYYSAAGFTDGRINTYYSPYLTPAPPK